MFPKNFSISQIIFAAFEGEREGALDTKSDGKTINKRTKLRTTRAKISPT